MKREERERQLQELREAQMSLMDVMSASDAHASKCIKLGLNFRNEYPSEYDAYEKARESYNANEIRIAELENMQVDEVMAMTDIASVENYDVTAGYPEMLKFEL